MNLVLFFSLSLLAMTLLGCAPGAGAGVSGAEEQGPPGHASGAAYQEPVRLRIHHYRVPCVGEGVQLCYLVRREDQPEWERFYEAIEGFDAYQWGHVYEVLVVREAIAHPAQDASRYRYVLAQILSDEAVPEGTTFTLTLSTADTHPYRSGSSVGGFRLVDEVAIACDAAEVCAALSEALQAGRTVEATLRHARGRVVLVSFIEV